MADDPNVAKPALGQAVHEPTETHVGRGDTLGVEVGMPLAPGQDTKPEVQREKDHGLEMEVGPDAAKFTRVDTNDPSKTVQLDKDGKPIPVTPEAAAPAAAAAAAVAADGAPALPTVAFDVAKPEAVEAFTKAYVNPDGKFNLQALSADWQRNAKANPDGTFTGGLTEDTYKFLETKGIDRATAKAVEAGQVAIIQQKRTAVFALAGGEQSYAAALKWATEGKGYDAAARAKFNQDLNAGGASQKDAVDLLMQRYAKANPTPRRASPAKSAADAANSSGASDLPAGVKPYNNLKEYTADFRKATASNDQALLNLSRARLRASPFYQGQQK